jgi:DNA mismatch repair protein MutL
MATIKLLDENLINKIAAGEVIERPASVVKELIENSLDAGATIINVEIKDSGKKLIKIVDNGKGMDEEDAKNCVIRHATSKISSSDDLFSIQTLGFRGEALASIAAVSKLGITTKKKDQLEGFNIVLEGGKIVSSGPIGSNEGTTIEVHDLFFNTPARKKFLKSDPIELRHTIDIVLRYSLFNKRISFKLTHEGHVLVNSPAVEDHKSNVASIYGVSLAKELLEINYNDENIKISGYIAKPNNSRNDKNQQSIFVNGRWVKNEAVRQAVYDGYHSLLFVGKHPIFILNLELNPKKIDVNVHPAKTEIKIEQKDLVKKAITSAVTQTLERNNLIPVMDINFEEQLTFGTSEKKVRQEEDKKKEVKYGLEVSEQTILKSKSDFEEGSYVTPEEEVFVSENRQEVHVEGNIKIPAMKILGQIHKTFFIAEVESGMMLIDQHVVQERVLYEKFMQQFMNKNVAVQNLLKGELIEFSASERAVILGNLEKLNSLGFNLEEFGDNSFILKTIPTVFGRTQPKELLYSVIGSLSSGKNKLEEIQEEIITRMACRASVKAGDVVSIPEIQKLLSELSLCNLPYTCPHGRAVLIKIPVDELEKKFKRK